MSAEGEGAEHTRKERDQEGAGSQHTMTSGLCLYLCRISGLKGVGMQREREAVWSGYDE